jgi:hypothetical protein
LVGAVRNSFCRDGVYQRVLDSDLSDPGRARFRGLPGQRTAREERSRPEDRRFGLPVAPVPTLGWTAPCQFSATWIHLCHTISLATSQQPDSNGSRARLACHLSVLWSTDADDQIHQRLEGKGYVPALFHVSPLPRMSGMCNTYVSVLFISRVHLSPRREKR